MQDRRVFLNNYIQMMILYENDTRESDKKAIKEGPLQGA